ncbi:MAG: helix-turn-helix domain-containing protein [Chloroflexi bacterium]|nr:helix-turn-helix domain-containing protein [Chloroflexota bacterium]
MTTETLGTRLRQAREAKSVSLAEAEDVTRIRRVYLEALETDRYDALPGASFVRGFVRNYAQYLGLNPEEALALLPGGLDRTTPISQRPAPRGDYPLLDVPLDGGAPSSKLGLILGLVLLAAALGVGGWWVYREYVGPWMQSRGVVIRLPLPAAATATLAAATPTTAVVGPTAKPSVTAVPAQAGASPTTTSAVTATARPAATATARPSNSPTARPTATPTATRLAGIEVRLVVVERSWVEVVADGARLYRGFMFEQEEQTFLADRRVELHLGNGGGVRVSVNGEDVGFLGAAGEVVHKEFVVDGVPTSTPTPAEPSDAATPTPPEQLGEATATPTAAG